MEKVKARILAMYLPQYYPITENDEVWGKGYTEWRCVAKARPLFKGHYQPHIPADLGFYDLRVPEIREQQAEMAKFAGIEGFMYWHYWMGNGKMLLDRPFKEVLASGKPDFPFCLAWANHCWKTSTWTTVERFQKNSIIVDMLYPGEEDMVNHFNYLLPAFKDKRYIKVDGKPFFLIYDPMNMPDLKKLMSLWNRLAEENGIPGIHFVGLTSGWEISFQSILDLGLDAITLGMQWQAQSKAIGGHMEIVLRNTLKKYLANKFALESYDYKKVTENMASQYDSLENAYPQIIPNWDRTPRSGLKGSLYTNSTPDLFKKHAERVIGSIQNKSEEHKIVILRSWNEWGEGNYMEPDEKYGWGYINALREVVFNK